jgi:hypothetical protein
MGSPCRVMSRAVFRSQRRRAHVGAWKRRAGPILSAGSQTRRRRLARSLVRTITWPCRPDVSLPLPPEISPRNQKIPEGGLGSRVGGCERRDEGSELRAEANEHSAARRSRTERRSQASQRSPEAGVERAHHKRARSTSATTNHRRRGKLQRLTRHEPAHHERARSTGAATTSATTNRIIVGGVQAPAAHPA